MPGVSSQEGGNVTLSLNYTDVAEMEEQFTKMSDGETVTMPPEDTFWGAKFGMFTDKFGIKWMMNCNTTKQ